jgi:membrane-associated phospholipid phosphatase
MNSWLEWGIPVINWFQNLGDWMIGPMNVLTLLGDEESYFLIFSIIIWCFDVGLGFRISTILLTSSSVNSVLKLAFGLPRPYWVSTQIKALKAATGFGLPSGHAQTSLAMWGRLAAWIGRFWGYIAFGLLIFLISVSRIFLAVHFPTDTLVGWFLGGTILIAFLRLERPIIERICRLSVSAQVGTAFFASLIILGLGWGTLILTSDRPVPSAWLTTAATLFPEAEPINPRSLKDVISSAGTLFGIGSGGAMLFSWGGFKASGPWRKRLGRYVLGVITIGALFLGLERVFPSGDTMLALSLHYVRYALVGLWASYLGPRLFVALQLA